MGRREAAAANLLLDIACLLFCSPPFSYGHPPFSLCVLSNPQLCDQQLQLNRDAATIIHRATRRQNARRFEERGYLHITLIREDATSETTRECDRAMYAYRNNHISMAALCKERRGGVKRGLFLGGYSCVRVRARPNCRTFQSPQTQNIVMSNVIVCTREVVCR